MIRTDRELAAAQAQIAHLHRVLQQMRSAIPGDEFCLVARSSRSMIERMQRDILDYLTQPAPHLYTPSQAASA